MNVDTVLLVGSLGLVFLVAQGFFLWAYGKLLQIKLEYLRDNLLKEIEFSLDNPEEVHSAIVDVNEEIKEAEQEKIGLYSHLLESCFKQDWEIVIKSNHNHFQEEALCYETPEGEDGKSVFWIVGDSCGRRPLFLNEIVDYSFDAGGERLELFIEEGTGE